MPQILWPHLVVQIVQMVALIVLCIVTAKTHKLVSLLYERTEKRVR